MNGQLVSAIVCIEHRPRESATIGVYVQGVFLVLKQHTHRHWKKTIAAEPAEFSRDLNRVLGNHARPVAVNKHFGERGELHRCVPGQRLHVGMLLHPRDNGYRRRPRRNGRANRHVLMETDIAAVGGVYWVYNAPLSGV